MLLLALCTVALASCADGGLFSPNNTGRTTLVLQPFFASENGSMATDINVIRLTIQKLPDGPTTIQEFPVDPAQSSWNVEPEVPPNSDVHILIELINRVGTTETTVYSGEIQVHVERGHQTSSPPPVQVFPGSPDNLRIQSVAIAPRDMTILEGATVTLSATVAPAIANPSINWISLSGNVATVAANGGTATVTGKLPGQAVITAFAGSRQDNITVTVAPRASKIEITPGSATVGSIGGDATFTARVLDVRNAVVPGLSVAFDITDPTIATQVSPGVFRARRNGTTTITATTVQAGQSITSTASLTVQQHATNISITPGGANLTSIGATQAFTAGAKDANNNDINGLTFTWTSSDQTVATVDANGLVTARGNGTANIKAEAAGASAEVPVTVHQTGSTLTLDPTSAELHSINETVQLHAVVRDALGNIVTTPITWISVLPSIATVDANGLVTATGDGPVVITANAGTLRAFATINVDRVVASIRMNPTHLDVDGGGTGQITAVAFDANGFRMNDAVLSWTSSNDAIATVSPSGSVHGVSGGDATITASAANGVRGNTTVHVGEVVVAGNGQLAGRVVEVDGNGIPNVDVTFSHGDATFTVQTAGDGTYLSPILSAGNWDVSASKTGFVTTIYHDAIVAANTTTQVEALILVPFSTFPGGISGTVRNARNNAGIGGATVEVRVGQNVTTGAALATTTADGSGNYSFPNLPAQVYTVTAIASGFADGIRTGIVVGSTTRSGQDVLVTPLGNATDMYIVLTWGANPRDLDSHLIVPGFGTDVAYYNHGSLTSPPYAQLDIDDVTGFGPETITLTQVLPGQYTYYVHHYSGSATIATSGAKVQVFRGNTRIATFDAPNEPGILWTVFSMNGTTITPVNHISNTVTPATSSNVAARPAAFEAAIGVQRILQEIENHPKAAQRTSKGTLQ